MTTDPILSSPKILPWFARRYDVPFEHVEALWHQAVLMADFRHGRDNAGPAYWQDTIETFLRLAADEGQGPEEQRHQEGGMTALHVLRAQDRVRRRTLSLVERMLRAGTGMWSRRALHIRKRTPVRH